nr:MAG TPA: hypothetical protein [Caudoviricetes sp.]
MFYSYYHLSRYYFNYAVNIFYKLAERVGFEPTDAFYGITSLAKMNHKPLGHLSIQTPQKRGRKKVKC